MAPETQLKLPISVVSQVDVARLIRELNSLNDFFISANLRSGGTAITPPRLTRVLDQLAKENRCNLLDETARKGLTDLLNATLGRAPLLHISFAAEPSTAALEKILVWLRENIDPHTLLQVGLQPTISAGCVLRTPNKLFDMSLRAHLKKQEPYLIELIEGAVRG